MGGDIFQMLSELLKKRMDDVTAGRRKGHHRPYLQARMNGCRDVVSLAVSRVVDVFDQRENIH